MPSQPLTRYKTSKVKESKAMKSYLDQDNIKAINNYIQAKPVKRDYKGLIVLCLIAVCALVVGTIEMGAL